MTHAPRPLGAVTVESWRYVVLNGPRRSPPGGGARGPEVALIYKSGLALSKPLEKAGVQAS
jgi:hypothetical protein